MRRLLNWITCHTLGHNWTALVEETGGKVPEEWKPISGESTEELLAKFKRFSAMYCRRCGYEYQP